MGYSSLPNPALLRHRWRQVAELEAVEMPDPRVSAASVQQQLSIWLPRFRIQTSIVLPYFGLQLQSGVQHRDRKLTDIFRVADPRALAPTNGSDDGVRQLPSAQKLGLAALHR